MPNCIIMGCPHKTGNNQKFPGIVLHSFPSSIERIKKWILQTGQVFQDPDSLANKIYEGKKTDTFRMCSAHFTKDSYIFTAQKRFLKHNALPAIFPQATEGKPLIDEQKIVGKRKKKSERLEAKNISSFICSRCLMSENICEGKVLVDAGTQTESNFLNQPPPVLPMTQTVLMLSVPLQSYCTQQITPIIKQPTHSLLGYSNQDLLNTSFQNITSATTSQSFPHPLVDGFPLSVPSEHYEKQDRMEESCPESDVNMLVENTDKLEEIVGDRKLLVFEHCLDSLVRMVKCRHASGCSKLVKGFNKEYRGSAVIIRGQCEDGHFFKIWESQPRVKRFFAGNVLLATSLFCSGLRYWEAHRFFKALRLRHISEKKYRYYQKFYCYPAIHAAWEKESKNVTRELQDRPLLLAGGRQCGTRGRNAGPCIYTLSDTITDKIVDFEMIPSSPCQSDMERHGFEMCMSRTITEGLDVACFVSGRNPGIVESMKENYAYVDHQFDVWQYAKGIKKKLKAASRSRFCANIRPWIQNIHDHFLWSVQTSENKEDLLREKWLSVLHHIVNKHSWDEGYLYKQCEHDDLSQKTLRETLWLKPGSPSFQKVHEIVTGPQLMADLRHLTLNCHNGASAMFHSNVLKTKRFHCGMDEIEARMKLAALDHNQKVGQRNSEVNIFSRNQTWDDRRSGVATKGKKRLLVNEPMSSDYLVMEGVLELCEGTKTTSYMSKEPSKAPSVPLTERPNQVRDISQFKKKKV